MMALRVFSREVRSQNPVQSGLCEIWGENYGKLQLKVKFNRNFDGFTLIWVNTIEKYGSSDFVYNQKLIFGLCKRWNEFLDY